MYAYMLLMAVLYCVTEVGSVRLKTSRLKVRVEFGNGEKVKFVDRVPC
jgi:hypothetical protein